MSWREENWLNPYPIFLTDEQTGLKRSNEQHPIFEAGAEAMLKAVLNFIEENSVPIIGQHLRVVAIREEDWQRLRKK